MRVEIRATANDEWLDADPTGAMNTPPSWWKESEHEWAEERAFALRRKGWQTRIIGAD